MYIETANEIYSEISNLSFTPEADVTGQSMPINEFSVDIYTKDNIGVSQWASLYDDNDNLWAKYWIIETNRLSENMITLQAQSVLARLDRKTVAAKWYYESQQTHNTVATIASELGLDSSIAYIDPSIANTVISGYCPEQTAKERLQWVCFVTGAYVRTFFTDKIEILPIDVDTEPTEIPTNKTFWRPSVSYTDFVTDINITAFSFTYTTTPPQNYEEYITLDKDGTKFLKITRTPISEHIDPPQDVPTTDITIDDVYLVNESNVDGILSRLGMIYFKRQELDADIINNGEYEPAHQVSVSLDPPDSISGRIVAGYIDSCDFSFGFQARSKIHMVVQHLWTTTRLVINYLYGSMKLGSTLRNYAVGVHYTVPNKHLVKTSGNIRKVYYPINEYATGTMVEGINVSNQPYDEALIFYLKKDENGVKKSLTILSVSGVDWEDQAEGVLEIE